MVGGPGPLSFERDIEEWKGRRPIERSSLTFTEPLVPLYIAAIAALMLAGVSGATGSATCWVWPPAVLMAALGALLLL